MKDSARFSAALILLCFFLGTEGHAQSLNQVSMTSSNPGNLRMHEYVPSPQPSSNAPLVVVMHGCNQTASEFFNDTEWYRLADRYGFYLVFPEQKSSNNMNLCFNWFSSFHQERGGGEALSIKQMVDRMMSDYPIDGQRIYVTGLSAGGAMTEVMMAAYPDIFSAGAIMAGLPYKSATSVAESGAALNGSVERDPQRWADSVRSTYPSYSGSYPRAAIFHGSSDNVVAPMNARESMEQWTKVHGVDTFPDERDLDLTGTSGIIRERYENGSSKTVVSRYTLEGMGHGIAVDPGSPLCQGKGGNSSNTAAIDFGLFSSYWAGRFFGIVPFAEVQGPTVVSQGEQGLAFTTPFVQGSSWNWEVPSGATIQSGQGSDSIVVDWGTQKGYVKVTRTDSTGCQGLSDSMEVGITSLKEPKGWPDDLELTGANPSEGSFSLRYGANGQKALELRLYDARGKRISLPQDHIEPGERLSFGNELSPGLYHLKVGRGSRSLIRK